MLNIKEISVIKKQKKILDNCSIKIENVSRLGIIGNNGAGKTTLIKCILGLESYIGSIKILADISNIQVLMQSNNYPIYAKAKDILKLILNINKFDTIERLIERFKFSNCLNTYIKDLSTGELQKLNLILVLASEPTLLIVDEITTGLDFETRKILINYLDNYLSETKCNLIIISHYPEEINKLTEKIIKLEDGKVSKICDTKDLVWDKLEGDNNDTN